MLIEVLDDEPAFVPDVYFTQGYGRLDALDRERSWATIADASGSWQMPIVLTDIGDGRRDATSPYGYNGIHVSTSMTGSAASAAWESARELLRGLGVVSLFLRFSPFDPQSVASAAGFDGLEIRLSGTTFVVTIAETDVMWDRMQGRARTAIRKAQRHGLTALVRVASPEDVLSGSDFRSLYEGTMLRVDAPARYSFDDAYYGGLLKALGADLRVVEVLDGGSVVASALVMHHGDRVHYHLSGSDPEGSRNGANVLLVWSMLEWCAATGVAWCHLGGGRAAQRDGLSRFKRSFGGVETDFHVGRAIMDQEAYARLTQERADQLGTTPGALEGSGFFPAFRAGGGE